MWWPHSCPSKVTGASPAVTAIEEWGLCTTESLHPSSECPGAVSPGNLIGSSHSVPGVGLPVEILDFR